MRVAFVVAVVAGCYAAVPPEGAPCSSQRECPRGQRCSEIDNRCYLDPADPVGDAAITGDAAPVDARSRSRARRVAS